jgi:hypothetical protein
MMRISNITVELVRKNRKKHYFPVIFAQTSDPCFAHKSKFFWQTARSKVA